MPLLSKTSRIILLGLLVLAAGTLFFGKVSITKADSTSLPITGYAWSDYLGWIHFNGSNYGVYEDSTTGKLSGYAWSPYFGWITFNESELNDCPSGSCQANISGNGSVTGWARSCASFSNKNACSGSLDSGSGGWDGWIHLSGSGYSITSAANSCWSGYAYGSQDIGFIKFAGTAADGYAYRVGGPSCGDCTNGANNYPTCNTCSDPFVWAGSSSSCVACSNGGCTGGVCNNGTNNPPTCTIFAPAATLSANPSTIDSGQSTTLIWSSTHSTSCTAAGGFSTGGATSGSVSSGPLTQNPSIFQITCSNSDNTSQPASATVTVLSPDATISATPSRVNSGDTSIISWSSSDANSCAVTRNGIAWKTGLSSSGISDTITSQTVYTITCQTNGTPINKSVTVNILSGFQEF